MLTLNNKTILVADLSGSFTHVAERLAKDFGHVLYWTAWQTGFSASKDFLPGVGLPDVERIAEFFDALEKVDMCMFTDVGYGDLQEFIRKEQIPVFGCGGAQVLELDRWHFKETLKTADMPVAKGRLVRGIEELRKVLQEEEDVYVKFSFFRGDGETYHHKNWFSSETWLDSFSLQLGPYGKLATFLIEEPIEGDSVEPGYDTFAVDGEIPENILWGYEVKDEAYIGTTDPLPDRLRDNAEAWSNILKVYKYRGIFSTEVKVTADKEYLIDATTRCPSPPSETECALIENFSEIVWEGAHGKLIEPDFQARYGVQLVLRSDWIVEHPLALDVGNKERVFIHGHFQIEGKDYAVVPEEFPEFAGAVGIGDTLATAIEESIDAAESVSGYQVSYNTAAFQRAMEAIEDGNRLGLNWTEPKLKKIA